MQWPFCPINGADRKVHLSSKQAIEHYYIIKLNDSFIDMYIYIKFECIQMSKFDLPIKNTHICSWMLYT